MSATESARYRELVFGDVHVRIFERYLETHMPGGFLVPAVPHDDAESQAKAGNLGYHGPDATWDMTRDHEIAHTLVAQMHGLPYSPALWAAAHGRKRGAWPGEVWAEEELVLAWQRWKNFRHEPITPP